MQQFTSSAINAGNFKPFLDANLFLEIEKGSLVVVLYLEKIILSYLIQITIKVGQVAHVF